MMMKRLTPLHLAAALLVAGPALAAWPWLFGYAHLSPPVFSGALIAIGLTLTAFTFGMAALDWASRVALALGAWSLVAPILFGFAQPGPAFWSHVGAGFIAMLAGIAGHELMERSGNSANA